MGNFSDRLSRIINSRKISVDDIVFGAEISRNAFFKYKNGSRIPASREIVERLIGALCLNRDEYDSLIEAYQIDTIGEYQYRGMRAVERFLTTPVEVMCRPETPFLFSEVNPMLNLAMIQGKVQVEMQIYATIREGLSRGNVILFETICDKDLFSIIQQASSGTADTGRKIEHIMAINESDGSNVSDRLYGIESLEKLIITMSRCENYYPFYYYASLSTLRIMNDIPNNIVIADDCVFCYSGNMDHGIFYRDVAICRIYRDIVLKWREYASSFAEKMDPMSGLKTFSRFYRSEDVYYSFVPGICLAAVVEKGDSYLTANDRQELADDIDVTGAYVEYAAAYRKMMKSGGRYRIIVPETMLRYNMREGYLGEVPKEMMMPLNHKQMRTLMRRFRRFSEMQDVRLLNDDRFPEGNTIGVDATPRSAVITVILPKEMAIRLFLIKEVSTAGLLYVYLKHHYEDEGITGRERSEWFEALLRE